MGARWYDPSTGRWLSADTVVPEPGNPQSLNRFSYVNNQPLRYTDPSGHYIPLEDPAYPYGAFAVRRTPYGWYVVSGGSHLRNYLERAWANHFLAGTPQPALPGGAFGRTVVGTATNACREASGERASETNLVMQDPLFAMGAATVAGKALALGLTDVFALAGIGAPSATSPAGPAPAKGTTVYRVYGSEPNDPNTPGSGPMGHSWTPVDPSSVPNYRATAGLPSGRESMAYNTGRFVVVGILTDPSGVTVRNALAVDGNPGGLLEWKIPNPATQIEIVGVYGVNPPY
jgi:hypothetical protein